MKGINPIWLTVAGLFLALQTNVATGNISLHDVLPDAWVPWAVGWAKAIASFGVAAGAFLPQFSSAKPGYFVSNEPVVTPAAKLMALFAVLIVGLLMLMPVARASDNLAAAPAKAVPVQAFGTSGLYYGIYTQGGGGSVQASVADVNSASLVTNQIGIGGAVGFAWALAPAGSFLAVEGMGKVNNVNGSQPGFAWGGPASFEERIKMGIPFDKVLAVIPNLGLPTAPPFPVLPANTVLLNTKSYLMAGFLQDDNSYAVAGVGQWKAWKLSGSIGVGMIGQLSNGTALDAWTEIVFANKATCIGAIKACANEGTKYLAGLGVWF